MIWESTTGDIGRRNVRLKANRGAADSDQLTTRPRETVSALGLLVRQHRTLVEAVLRPHQDDRETTYSVDDGWRRIVIEAWFERSIEHARTAHWLIAREAAAQSHAYRTAATDSGLSLGFRRDVQAMFALVASLNVDALVSFEHLGTITDPSLEAHILPSLDDMNASPPEPTRALRYAFLQLYKFDLDGDAFRQQALMEDASLRLSLLLPFFDPKTPWLPQEQRRVQPSISSYNHLLKAFSHAEFLDLLTSLSLSAMRIRRFDLVCAVAHLAHELARLPRCDVKPSALLMPLRAEIDAAILAGGNPEAFLAEQGGRLPASRGSLARLPTGVQLSDIGRRIEKLLQTTFSVPAGSEPTDDLLLARGKLFARLGEAQHVAGELKAAELAFHQAVSIDCKLASSAARLGPVLGGRGARSYLRFLVGEARCPEEGMPLPCHRFADGLSVPVPPLVASDNKYFRQAQRLFSLNARRLGRGRAADLIGSRIDGARLHILRHEFDAALSLLDTIVASPFSAGTSIDVLLELLAVRARMLIDATLVCSVAAGQNQVMFAAESVNALVRYAGVDKLTGEDPITLAARILDRRAAKACRAFSTYAGAWGTHHPYFTFSTYLMAWQKVLQSRLRVEKRAEFLAEALFHLAGARRHMQEGEYRMHFKEASYLARSIRGITPPTPTLQDALEKMPV